MSLGEKVSKATTIDNMITFFVVALTVFLPMIVVNPGSKFGYYEIYIAALACILLIFPISALSPLLFKNSSIGMRMVGLAIVGADGYRPPLKIVLMRQLLYYWRGFSSISFLSIKKMLSTFDDLESGLAYFGTKIVDVQAIQKQDKQNYKHINPENRTNKQYLIPITKRQDYNSYTPIIARIIVISLLFAMLSLSYFVVFPALNIYEIYPWAQISLLVLSGIVFFFGTILLMASIGHILYVSEKKKLLLNCK